MLDKLQATTLIYIAQDLPLTTIHALEQLCKATKQVVSDQLFWQQLCRSLWIGNQRLQCGDATTSWDTSFDQVHIPLEKKVPLFSQDFSGCSEKIKPNRPPASWRELHKTELTIRKYFGTYEYNSGLVNAGDFFTRTVKLQDDVIYHAQDETYDRPETALDYNEKEIQKIWSTGQYYRDDKLYYQRIDDNYEYKKLNHLPLGHRFYESKKWDCYEYSETHTISNGIWTVYKGTALVPEPWVPNRKVTPPPVKKVCMCLILNQVRLCCEERQRAYTSRKVDIPKSEVTEIQLEPKKSFVLESDTCTLKPEK